MPAEELDPRSQDRPNSDGAPAVACNPAFLEQLAQPAPDAELHHANRYQLVADDLGDVDGTANCGLAEEAEAAPARRIFLQFRNDPDGSTVRRVERTAQFYLARKLRGAACIATDQPLKMRGRPMLRLFDLLNLTLVLILIDGAAFAQIDCGDGNGVSVPEPASLSLFAVGVGGLFFAKRFRRSSRVVSFIAFAAAAALWSQVSPACN